MCTSTYQDVGRIINKFDIYICDLGEMVTGGDLGKSRPCVIVSSDKYNSPMNNKYVIVPIRTEHKTKIETKEDAIRLAKEKRRINTFYIPIDMGEKDYRFIDVTEMKKIQSSKILKYVFSITNEDIKREINNAIVDFLFSDDELKEIYNGRHKSSSDQYNVTDKRPETKKIENFPIGFSLLYSNVVNKKISLEYAAKKLGISTDSFQYLMDKYAELNSMRNNSLNNEDKENKTKTWSRKRIEIPDNFGEVYEKLKRKEIKTKEAIEILGMNYSTFYRKKTEYENMLN